MASSTYFADGDQTTTVAGMGYLSGSFTPGEMKDTGSETSSIWLSPSEFTELEYSIKATSSATGGATYCFRLTDAGTVTPFAVAIYPEVTLAAAVVTPPTTRLRNGGGGGGGGGDTSTPAPATDPTVSGNYDRSTAMADNPDIDTDKRLTTPPSGTPTYCTAGSLIKGSFPAIYYCGADGKRYVFVNDKAYFSWYPDFSSVKTIPDTDLAKITLGGNITYRPGFRMVKIRSNPKVYAVARGGILRWVTTEAVAVRLYGSGWNKLIDDVSDAFFVNYILGSPITE
jgi:hypothetical protein